VFVGGASFETIERVCGPADEVGGDVFEGISGLVDHSLLVQHDEAGESRFAMLETIREFALERLTEGGEADEMHARHLATFVDLAERAAPELTGVQQKTWLDTLEREHDNLRAALDSAVRGNMAGIAMGLTWTLWRFWQMRGHLHEASMRASAVLALPHAAEHPEARARAYEAAGSIDYWRGDLHSARRHYEDALRVSREIDDASLIANALYNLSFPYAFTQVEQDLASARSLLEEALAIFRKLNDRGSVGRVLWALGNALLTEKQFAAAKPVFDEALATFRAIGDRFHTAWTLHELGLLAIRLGNLAEGRHTLSEAIGVFADARDVSGVILLLDDFSELTAAEGRPLQAIRLAAAASALQASSGTNLAEVSNRIMGRERLTAGESDEAMAAWAEGKAMRLEAAVECALQPLESETAPTRLNPASWTA
jgi:tetratricopeptide (TPR) repeat protein